MDDPLFRRDAIEPEPAEGSHAGFARLARLAGALLDAPLGAVSLIAGERQRVVGAARRGTLSPGVEALLAQGELPLAESLCRETMRVGGPVLVADAASDPRVATLASVVTGGVRAYAGVPIHGGAASASPVGTLCVVDWSPRAWDAGAADRLTELAAIAGDEVALHEGVRRLTLAERRLTLQRRVLERVAGAEPATRLLADLAREVEPLVRTAWCEVVLRDERTGRLRLVGGGSIPADVARALDDVPVGPSHGSCAAAVDGDRLVLVEDLRGDPRWAAHPGRDVLAAHGVRAAWAAPIPGPDGTPLGALTFYLRETRAPDREERVLLEESAALARVIVDRGRAHAAEHRFRAFVEGTSELLALLDGDGYGLYANAAHARTLGWPTPVRPGFRVPELVHPDDMPQVQRAWAEALGARAGRSGLRMRLRHADGSWRTLRTLLENMLDDPAVRAVVCVSRDVTTEESLEEQLRQAQKLEAVGRLAGGIAHDFNNVLTVMHAGLRFVRDALPEPAPAAVLEDLAEVERAVGRATALARQLLTFSRRAHPAPRALVLDDVVRGVESMLRRVLGAEVELVALLDTADVAVLADAGQLEQVLLNLAVNARDAMPDGGVLVIETCRVEPDEPRVAAHALARRRWAALEVTDTGAGMDAETSARIFEPFFTTKPVGVGTGLGLAIVHAIVQAAGGEIRVRTQRGVGTTFTVYLPVLSSAAALAAEVGTAVEGGGAGGAAAGVADGAGATVLLAEDERGVRSVVRRALERAGHRVLEARHGADAHELWRAHGGPEGRVDLVLTDLTMPEMGGRELIERLHAARAAQPVIVMTGYPAGEARSWAEAQGLPVLDKPFTAPDLARRVAEVLRAAG